MRKILFMVVLLFLSVGRMAAQSEGLKMHLDFSTVSGTNVTDAVGNIQTKLMNQAKVTKMGPYAVLDLGNGTGYLDLTAAAGKLLTPLNDFTISVYYRIDATASLSGAGHFLWTFSQSQANTQTTAAYLAYRLNAQRMAISSGGWGSEKAVTLEKESEKGRWVHVLYRQTGQKGELYLDGKQSAQNTAMPLLKNVFTTAPAYNWLGRPAFSTDSYLKNTLIADFRLYDRALSNEEVALLASETTSLEEAYLNGGGGDNEALLSAIAEAEGLLSQADNYPDGAVLMLQDAVKVARAISKQDLNQMAFDKQESSLRKTIAAFKTAKDFVFDVSGLSAAYDTHRGFRHPGGLHTEADFERIRQLLADGNQKVTEAYAKLKAAAYSQSGVTTYPVETIVRGGGVGENYINAARGATMAYQNALRWKIEGTKANAATAVRILMAWANTCKAVSGDSNWALAAGLYGYEFAQAAELVRDYEGWAKEDFEKFKQWMLTVWYPGNINFLRGRNGTWENYVGNQGGIRPGHYWSNWPLCNVLAVISIGILCDDVFIYNQGLSFMKYDQVGTFKDPRSADPILNDGCTEFLGNLIVTTHESSLETGAYGRLGQMQESGRDGGHAAMALGLAVDICHVAWNQGDDLFSYMDNRMAAGIEFVAACTQNVQHLPWTNYKYVDCRTAWHNGWLMTGPAEPAEVRNYWGTVIGHYEGVKGVKMPFSEQAYSQMGIDVGGTGGTSGAYDHLGYSLLMNMREEQLCPEEKRPTLLTPRMLYDGKQIDHNELGGLRNSYVVRSTECVPAGQTVTLMPQLPDGEEDTGQWLWNTGQTTKDITVNTDQSYLYRVTYTNKNGVKSEQCFAIAVEGDCTASPTRQSIKVNGEIVGDSVATVFYGDEVTLSASDAAGWFPKVCWDNGMNGQEVSYGAVAADRTIQGYVVSQGGRKEVVSYQIKVRLMQPRITHNGTLLTDRTTLVCKAGDDVTLQLYIPKSVEGVSYRWSNGSVKSSLTIPSVASSGLYEVEVSYAGKTETITFEVFLKEAAAASVQPGCYMVRDVATDTYMTANGLQQAVTFMPGDSIHPADHQVWIVNSNKTNHSFMSLADSTGLAATGTTIGVSTKVFYLDAAVGLPRYALRTGTSATSKYWSVDPDGQLVITQTTNLETFPFELIPVSTSAHVSSVMDDNRRQFDIYDLHGRRLREMPQHGVFLRNSKKYVR